VAGIGTGGGDDRRRRVFVVHGRNEAARSSIFVFLRSIGLAPIEWSQAMSMTGEASPHIGRVLDIALDAAQAVVVLLTPDEFVALRPEYVSSDEDPDVATGVQARPNVLFEAGMAMGRDASRTVLVQLGEHRAFSDIAGRHILRLTNSLEHRQSLAGKLANAGCSVDLSGTDWHRDGDFTPPMPAAGTKNMFEGSTSAGPSGGSTATASAPRQTNLEKMTLRIGEPKDNGVGGYSVVGEATNNDAVSHSAALLATFYDSNGNILGIATGVVTQVGPKETKTFRLMSTDSIGGYSAKKVETSTLM